MAHQAISIRQVGAALAYLHKAEHTQHPETASISDLRIALAKSAVKARGDVLDHGMTVRVLKAMYGMASQTHGYEWTRVSAIARHCGVIGSGLVFRSLLQLAIAGRIVMKKTNRCWEAKLLTRNERMK